MATAKTASKSASGTKKKSSGTKKPVVKAESTSKTTAKAQPKVTRAGDSQLKLNIDYKTLLALLPLVLPLIGKITNKDSENGKIEFEKESSTGELLGYVLKLVSGKKGETLLSLDSANNTPEEKSELGGVLTLLGNVVNSNAGAQLLEAVTGGGKAGDNDESLLGGLLDAVSGGASSKKDDSALGGILDLLGGTLK